LFEVNFLLNLLPEQLLVHLSEPLVLPFAKELLLVAFCDAPREMVDPI